MAKKTKKRNYKKEYQRRKKRAALKELYLRKREEYSQYKKHQILRKPSVRKKIVRFVIDNIIEPDELHSDEREDAWEDFREALDMDFYDWLEIATAEGYSVHDAYEMWYYP